LQSVSPDETGILKLNEHFWWWFDKLLLTILKTKNSTKCLIKGFLKLLENPQK
jgi:hypothetical protein